MTPFGPNKIMENQILIHVMKYGTSYLFIACICNLNWK